MRKKIMAVIAVMLCMNIMLSACGTVNTKDLSGGSIKNVPQNEALMNNYYAANSQMDDYVSDAPGLKNPFIVGADKQRFDMEKLYPVPTENVKVFDVTAAPYNVKADDKKDDARGIQMAIEAAKAEEKSLTKIIRLPKGRIDIIEGMNGVDYAYGLVIDGAENIVIDGNGADLMISCFLGMSGFHIINSKNVLLNNFTVDYTIPPYMMGKVVAFDKQNKTIEVSVNSGYNIDTNAPVIQYVEYDGISKLPLPNGNYLYVNDSGKSIESSQYVLQQDGSYRIKIKAAAGIALTDTPIGTIVALGTTFYVAQLFMVENNENIKFETITAYSAWGMTLRAYSNKNIYINAFRNICKPGTDRLFTASADILHIKNTEGEIKITNSQLENSHDDAINIGGHLAQVTNIDASSKNVTSIYKSGMWGTFKPKAGEQYEIMNVETFEIIGTVTVKTVKYTADGYVLTFEETELATTDERFFDFSKITTKHALANITAAPTVLIDNNVIRNKRNRGILIQSRKVIVSNNLFSNIVHGAIMLVADTAQFNESLAPQDVTIINNKFLRNGGQHAYGDIDSFCWSTKGIENGGAIKNINITNNFFGESYNNALSMRGVQDFDVEHNMFYRSGYGYINEYGNSAVYVEKSDKLRFTKNALVKTSDPAFKSIYTLGKLSSGAIVLTDNEGIELDENATIDAVAMTQQSKGAITVDGELNDWADVSSTIKMVGATYGASKIEVGSVDKTDLSYTIKVTYDEDGLYLSFDIIDNNVKWLPSWWNGDFIEVFISNNITSGELLESFKTLYPDEDFAQIYMANLSGGVESARSSQKIIDGAANLKYSFKASSGGYKGEMFIPFAVIPKMETEIKAGREVSLSVTLGDYDDDDEGVTITRVSSVNYPLEENKRTPEVMSKIKKA